MRLRDHVKAVGLRDEILRFITESPRDGLASSAEISPDGVNQELKGLPPQGEHDTLRVCRQLVEALNASDAIWLQPEEGDRDEDCVCRGRDSSAQLRIQVVRAVADRQYWQDLARQRELSESLLIEAAADRLKHAIEHKTGPDGIPPENRESLVLALDAGRVPALAFEEVAVGFRKAHGDWARGRGFQGIWVVGPDPRMIHRLA